MNTQHQTFINACLAGQDKESAYAAAYPKAKSSARRSAANRLLGRPDIKAAIEQRQSTVNAIVEERVAAHRTAQALDMEEAKALLQSIIRGQHVTYRNMRLKDGFEQVEVYPSHAQILRALGMYLKLAGLFPQTATKNQQQQTTTGEEEMNYLITVGDKPLSPVADTKYEQWYPHYYAGTHWDPTDPAERPKYLEYINTLGEEERAPFLDKLRLHESDTKVLKNVSETETVQTTTNDNNLAKRFPNPSLVRRGEGEPETIETTCVKRQQLSEASREHLEKKSSISEQLATIEDDEYIPLQQALAISKARRETDTTRTSQVQVNLLNMLITTVRQHKAPKGSQRAMLKESGWELHTTDCTKVRPCTSSLNLGRPYLVAKGRVNPPRRGVG